MLDEQICVARLTRQFLRAVSTSGQSSEPCLVQPIGTHTVCNDYVTAMAKIQDKTARSTTRLMPVTCYLDDRFVDVEAIGNASASDVSVVSIPTSPSFPDYLALDHSRWDKK